MSEINLLDNTSKSESENNFYKFIISFYGIIILLVCIRYFYPIIYNSYKNNNITYTVNYLLGASSKNDKNHDWTEKIFSFFIPVSYIYYNFIIINKSIFLMEDKNCKNNMELLKLLSGNILFSIFMIFYSYIPFNDQLDDKLHSMFYFWSGVCLLNIIINSSLLIAYGYIYEKEYCD